MGLRAIPVLERDLGLVSNINGHLTTTCNSSSKGSDVLLASMGTGIHVVQDITSQVGTYTFKEGWVGSQKTLHTRSCRAGGTMQEAWQFLRQHSVGLANIQACRVAVQREPRGKAPRLFMVS